MQLIRALKKKKKKRGQMIKDERRMEKQERR